MSTQSEVTREARQLLATIKNPTWREQSLIDMIQRLLARIEPQPDKYATHFGDVCGENVR